MRAAVLVALLGFHLLVSCQLLISVQEAGHNHVSYSITNEGPEAVQILTFGTPFEAESLFFPVLDISNDVAYIGPLARRVTPPPPEAFLTLPSKATLSIVVDIHQFYSVENEDIYEINALIPDFNPTLAEARLSGSISKHLRRSGPSKPRGNRANQYENCSANEQNQVASSTTTAIAQSRTSYSCMNAKSCNTLTQKWFGATSTVNTGYYDYDKSVFNNIVNTLNSKGIHAYCNPAGCGANVYAYVYPNDPALTVYLCGAFWSQPSERANTIVHEMSHFTVIGGTQDYTYGRASCEKLAKSNPFQASHNADNVCYFSDDA